MRSLFTFCFLFIYTFSIGQEISDFIRFRLENGGDESGKLVLRGRELKNSAQLFKFYSDRNFRPVWIDQDRLKELAYEARYEIDQSQFDGLIPSDYHFDLINTFFEAYESNKDLNQVQSLTDLSDVELLLSDGLIQLAKHLLLGKVDPVELKRNWDISRKNNEVNAESFLIAIERSGTVRSHLFQFYPEFRIYLRGREVMRSLSEQAKVDSLDWKVLKSNKSIEVGEVHSLIPDIRQRLVFWGFYDILSVNDKYYDTLLMTSVIAYQTFNGLVGDGIIGKNTLSALNKSPEDLMGQVAVNLERLRWLDGKKTGNKAILVNIANFNLVYFEKEDTVFQSKVIVGKSYHQSPVFEAMMSYIVFSPYWNIPESIVRNEIIPSVRKNPNYIANKNMEVLTYGRKVVDPKEVDWKKRSIPYLVRQKPGPNNSLGLVKFMFPNKYSVYIHDTPAKSLFSREVRALSHGCIRLEKPREFANLLLKDQTAWNDEKIWNAMNRDREQTVNLNEKIPVYLIYLTFWADPFGKPHFRQDIYNRDAEVLTLLRK